VLIHGGKQIRFNRKKRKKKKKKSKTVSYLVKIKVTPVISRQKAVEFSRI
jgi:hypothetical protein